MDFDAVKLAALVALLTLLLRKFGNIFRNTTAGAMLHLLQMYGAAMLHPIHNVHQSPPAELSGGSRRRRSLEGSRARSEVLGGLDLSGLERLGEHA